MGLEDTPIVVAAGVEEGLKGVEGVRESEAMCTGGVDKVVV